MKSDSAAVSGQPIDQPFRHITAERHAGPRLARRRDIAESRPGQSSHISGGPERYRPAVHEVGDAGP